MTEPSPAAEQQNALQRIQGKFTQPEVPKAATWNWNGLADRMPYDVAKDMAHDSSLVLPAAQMNIMLMAPQLVALGRMGLVLAPAGAGKTVLLGCVRAACPHRVVHLDLKSSKTNIGMAKAVYFGLTGTEYTVSSTRGPDPIWRAVEAEMGSDPSLLIVDEVQWVHNSALMAVEDLAKRTAGRFGVLVAGSDKAESRLQKDEALWRRMSGFRKTLPKLEGDRMLKTLSDWHPLLKDADPKLLKRINTGMCHGSWGEWRNFVEAHQGHWGRDKPLTEESAKPALARYGRTLGPA